MLLLSSRRRWLPAPLMVPPYSPNCLSSWPFAQSVPWLRYLCKLSIAYTQRVSLFIGGTYFVSSSRYLRSGFIREGTCTQRFCFQFFVVVVVLVKVPILSGVFVKPPIHSSQWYNRTCWSGVKYQFTFLLFSSEGTYTQRFKNFLVKLTMHNFSYT